jgi:tmRNA-binding protein
VCRGKKFHDKREAVAEREQERDARREMSLRNSRHLQG